MGSISSGEGPVGSAKFCYPDVCLEAPETRESCAFMIANLAFFALHKRRAKALAYSNPQYPGFFFDYGAAFRATEAGKAQGLHHSSIGL